MKLKHVAPSAEVSLAIVRELSEHAMLRPAPLYLHCRALRPATEREGIAFQPWNARWFPQIRRELAPPRSVITEQIVTQERTYASRQPLPQQD